MDIGIRVANGDALGAKVDVLALKYAQGNFGLDDQVADLLSSGGIASSRMRPQPASFSLINTEKIPGLNCRHVLFVGVVPLFRFGYPEIREFSRRVLSTLATTPQETQRIVLTLHGAGYGLDELEAFEAEIAGLVEAVRGGEYPGSLSEILVMETNPGRAERMRKLLRELLPMGVISPAPARDREETRPQDSERLRSAGYASGAKDHVFVAMPFSEKMDDVYHYGIQAPVKAAGFICERADLSAFTGNVMQWIRERIKSAKLVVADLSDANPNVYLEVGYAWGCGIPTLLLVTDLKELKFDVLHQKCLTYKKIKDLEDSLAKELKKLQDSSAI